MDENRQEPPDMGAYHPSPLTLLAVTVVPHPGTISAIQHVQAGRDFDTGLFEYGEVATLDGQSVK